MHPAGCHVVTAVLGQIQRKPSLAASLFSCFPHSDPDLVQSSLSPENMTTASVDLMNFPVLFCTSSVTHLYLLPLLVLLAGTTVRYAIEATQKYPMSLPHS